MALFPRIQSPCPYKDSLGEIMDGSHCRMCDRQVHDITAMSDDERIALVSGCKDEICVSYRLTARTALAAAAMGAAFGMPMAAAAQDAPAQDAGTQASAADEESYDPIIVGGLKLPQKVVWVDTKKPANLAELPVTYETGPADATPAPAPQQAEASTPDEDEIIIIAGGLKQPGKTQWVDPKKPANLAELPVVEEPAAKDGPKPKGAS